MWLHGGYTTFFPYISSDGAGSDYGTTVCFIQSADASLPLPDSVRVERPGHTGGRKATQQVSFYDT